MINPQKPVINLIKNVNHHSPNFYIGLQYKSICKIPKSYVVSFGLYGGLVEYMVILTGNTLNIVTPSLLAFDVPLQLIFLD